MKALLLAAAVAVSVLACSSGTAPAGTEWSRPPTLDPSIPLLGIGDAIEIVWAHLEDTWHDESASSCQKFLDDNTDYRMYSDEYVGDRTWQVTTWGVSSESRLAWKVRELSATTGEVVESPEWLEDVGCG